MTDQPPDTTLPCGCFLSHKIVDGVNTLKISPCRMDCPNLANLLKLGQAKGLDPEFRQAP